MGPVLLLPLTIAVILFQQTSSFVPISSSSNYPPSCIFMNKAAKDREAEIRQKIIQLKKAGKITNVDTVQAELDRDDLAELSPLDKLQLQRKRMQKSSVIEEYDSAIKEKLGNKKAVYLGMDVDPEEPKSKTPLEPEREGQLGSLSRTSTEETKPATQQINVLDPLLQENLDDEEDDDSVELSEEDLVELVARKLKEKRAREREQEEAERAGKISEIAKASRDAIAAGEEAKSTPPGQTTSGIGGSWTKNETAQDESYRPSRGSWGYFERPKDISKAYGGGRRVGVGYTKESDARLSDEATKLRLKEYREKVGIDVQSEKDHAEEIEEALKIAGLAMQRGIYSAAVSSLEKVTKFCSSNSKVGGKVFLDLAMAYEANGQTAEAISVYQVLTKCRIEDIKNNAKKLLYGIEALTFMRDEAKSEAFSKKKSRSAFIDTTGFALANIANNFDDVYRTGYVDIESGYFRKLSESVVRSNREARQILLKATTSGEVTRSKIVQALRSISRHFDEALEKEIEDAAPPKEPVAFIDGKPIMRYKKVQESQIPGVDDFVLASASQMVENLKGEWRLQLVADKKGDGVKYYDSNVLWQYLDTDQMGFSSASPSGFMTLAEVGSLAFQKETRILERSKVESSAGFLSGIFPNIGATSSIVPQQIVTVDSALLITRCAPHKLRTKDEIREHFAVWRRVDTGTYSRKI